MRTSRWLPSKNNRIINPTIIHVPLPFAVLLSASILVLLYSPNQIRRRKRRKLGLCLRCGYDLRGSKERCPECGATIER
jgi:hypothetical protein